jgi:hypothetical protein
VFDGVVALLGVGAVLFAANAVIGKAGKSP